MFQIIIAEMKSDYKKRLKLKGASKGVTGTYTVLPLGRRVRVDIHIKITDFHSPSIFICPNCSHHNGKKYLARCDRRERRELH